jgi:hypothetical protein
LEKLITNLHQENEAASQTFQPKKTAHSNTQQRLTNTRQDLDNLTQENLKLINQLANYSLLRNKTKQLREELKQKNQ